MSQVPRFRMLKTFDEEKECVIHSIPKSTVYKNKWALQIFREWQDQRANKICTIEPGVVFKGEDIVSKSLNIFIQSFIGYPNTCTWYGIHAVSDL